MSSSSIGLYAPKVPIEVNIESLKEFNSQFEKFEATAKKVLNGQKIFLSSPALKDKPIKELESCDVALIELSKTINDLYQEDTHFDQTNKKLDDLKNESQVSREKIYKEAQQRLNEWLDSIPFQSSYDSFNLKEKILEGLPRLDSLSSAVKYLEDCQRLLKSFSPHQLARTNLPITTLIELSNDNRSLLEKILKAGIWFPNNFVEPEKVETLINLTIKFTHDYLPFFVRIFDYSQRHDLSVLNSLFQWTNEEIDKGKSLGSVAEFLEKVLAIYIFDNSSYGKYLKSLVDKRSYEELYQALQKVSSVKNIVNEWDLKPEIPEKPPPGWYSKKTTDLIKAMGPPLEKSIRTWINKYKTYSRPTLSRTETTDDLMNNEIYVSLWKLHHLKVSEAEKLEILSLFNSFPFHSKYILRLFNYSSKDTREKLIKILRDNPHLGLEILRLDPVELEFNLQLKDKLEETFGKAVTYLMLRMLKLQPLRNRYASLLTMKPEEIRFYSKTLDKPWDSLYVLNQEQRDLLEKYPRARVFFEQHGFYWNKHLGKILSILKDPKKAQKFEDLLKAGRNNPHPLINNIVNSFSASSTIDFYYELVNRKLPRSVLAYFLSVPRLEDDLPRKLVSYIQESSKNESLDRKAIREIKAVIDLSKEYDEDICLKLLSHFKVEDDLSRAALIVINDLQSEAVPTLLNLNPQNIHDLKLIRRIIKEDQLSLESRSELLEKARKHNVSGKVAVQSNVSPHAGTFAFSKDSVDDALTAALDIAANVLCEDGSIDLKQLELIRYSDTFNSNLIPFTLEDNLINTIDILLHNPDFSERLKKVKKIPKKGSSLELLIRKMLGKEDLTLHDVRVAVLSGVLWPTRQGKIGSCFSTSIIIQGESYAEGLRQKLEDFVMMVEDNCITRLENGGLVRKSYPIFAKDLAVEASYSGDHLLSRTREFIIAFKGAIQYLEEVEIVPMIQKVFNRICPESIVDIQKKLFKDSLHFNAQNLLKRVYIPTKRNPAENELGAWCLYSKENGSLIESFHQFQATILQLAENVRNDMLKLYPEDHAEWMKIFLGDGGIFQWIFSAHFVEELSHQTVNSLAKLNPLHLMNQAGQLWINYEGGNTENLMRSYFNLPSLEVSRLDMAGISESKKIEVLMDKMLSLPKSMKGQILSSANTYIPISSNTDLKGHEGHSYSLKPKRILKLAQTYKTSEKIMTVFNGRIADFLEKSIDRHIIIKILEEMKDFSNFLCDGTENYPLLFILSNPSLLKSKTYQSLWDSIEKEISAWGFFDVFMKEIARDSFNLALQETQVGIPKINIGDTNWDGMDHLVCIPDVVTGHLRLYFVGDTGGEHLDLNYANFPSIWPRHTDFNLVESKKIE